MRDLLPHRYVFHVSQLVRCRQTCLGFPPSFHKGGIYKVKKIQDDGGRVGGIEFQTLLIECDDTGSTTNGWSAFFFEPYDETPFQQSLRSYIEAELK